MNVVTNDAGRRALVRYCAAAATAALVLASAACSGDTGGSAAGTASPGASVATTTAGSPTSATGGTSPTGGTSSAAQAATSYADAAAPADGQFASSSRNIGCRMTTSLVYCFIFTKNWANPARPASCEGDVYGQELGVSTSGRAETRCDGQPQLDLDMSAAKVSDRVPVLAYGHAYRLGDFRCSSDQTLVRCENTATQHGFTLAKENYTLF
jgi:hypothetical protein